MLREASRIRKVSEGGRTGAAARVRRCVCGATLLPQRSWYCQSYDEWSFQDADAYGNPVLDVVYECQSCWRIHFTLRSPAVFRNEHWTETDANVTDDPVAGALSGAKRQLSNGPYAPVIGELLATTRPGLSEACSVLALRLAAAIPRHWEWLFSGLESPVWVPRNTPGEERERAPWRRVRAVLQWMGLTSAPPVFPDLNRERLQAEVEFLAQIQGEAEQALEAMQGIDGVGSGRAQDARDRARAALAEFVRYATDLRRRVTTRFGLTEK